MPLVKLELLPLPDLREIGEREQSHDVCSVYDEARGMADDDVLAKAHAENRILITNDKDVGEMVFRDELD